MMIQAPPDRWRIIGRKIMKTNSAVALAMLAGVGLGAVAIQGLHAQSTPKAYVIVAVRNVTDPDTFKTVMEKAPPALAASGGHYVVRTDKITGLDGNPPKRFVLLTFDSVAQAEAWHNSAAQKEVDALRIKSTESIAFMVEGN
jgi:uncharacterized protein (DUF1330 family)